MELACSSTGEAGKTSSLESFPGVEVIKLFSSSLMQQLNKLECLILPRFFSF
jgi:hypothetical protein